MRHLRKLGLVEYLLLFCRPIVRRGSLKFAVATVIDIWLGNLKQISRRGDSV